MENEVNFSWYRRAMDSIAQGSLTNSKRPECFVKSIYPTHVDRGNGCHLSLGKRKWIDYICGLGTNLFGYGNTEINEAIFLQLHKGIVYSLGSTIEVEAAEKIKEIIPFARKIRFLKTGSEAALASLRIAMAHTGRTKVLSHGYHGFGDPFISLSPPALGIAPQPHVSILNDLSQIDNETACVIVEPVITDYSPARLEYLKDLQAKCKKHGAVLIFDEIITGFRWPHYTFSQDSGIFPDIILLGKAIAGGLPLSVVAMKEGIGEGKEWFVSSTFAGDTLALAAMMKCLEMLRNTHKIERLWESGYSFINKFNSFNSDIIKIDGYPSRGVFIGEPLNKALFFQESCRAGILFGASFFYNFDHIIYNDIVLSTCKDIIIRITNKQVELHGELPKTPFAQQIRSNT